MGITEHSLLRLALFTDRHTIFTPVGKWTMIERQQQIRLQLSMSLKAVLSQQLLPKVGGGRVLACEVMKTDGAIRNLIREGKTPQIANAIQTTGSIGNVLMDKTLQGLFGAGTISRETYEGALRDQAQAKNGPGGMPRLR